MTLSYKFTLGNYDCNISKTDEGITIEAEHKESGQLFSKIITEESVKTISKDPFFDLPTIYQVIQDFFEEKPDTASLSLTPNGKLNYICKLSFGKVIKELGFEVQLERKEMDALANLERAFNKLSSRVSHLENKPNQEMPDEYLKGFEKRLFDKIEGIEKRLAKVEEKIERIENKEKGQYDFKDIEYEFDPNIPHFTLSNSNKTLTATSQCAGKAICTKQPFPKSYASKISFKIEDNSKKGLGLGIAPSTAFLSLNPFLKSKTYMYYSFGNVWKNGETKTGAYAVPGTGDTVTLLLDPNTGEVTVSINEKIVDKHVFNVDDLKAEDFYGFVFTGQSIGGVTIL